MIFRNGVGPATVRDQGRLHRLVRDILYPKRPGSQVTNLGTYRTSHGRRVPVKEAQ